MTTYNINIRKEDGFDILDLSFGIPAENDQIVKDVTLRLHEMEKANLFGGKLIKLDGKASIPVAVAITHILAHYYGAIAVKDPKLGKFVVSVTHNPDYPLGALID